MEWHKVEDYPVGSNEFDIGCVHDWVFNGIISDVDGMAYRYYCTKCGKIFTSPTAIWHQ